MLGLSFLVPAFLAGLAAAAVPILLHLFKRDTAARRMFAAVFLIRRTPVEQTARRQLRELLLLALRVMALVVLALAFARPYRAGAVGEAGGVSVVAVDRSFSLSAPGQFDRARELAVEAVRSSPNGHRVAVVAFDDTAEVVADASGDRQAAIAAIGRLTPGVGATRYRAGLARAALLVGARPGRIVVVTDLQRNGWAAQGYGSVPSRVAVEAAIVPPPAGNLAVTAIRPESSSTSATILNGGGEAQIAAVRLVVDGAEVDRTMVTAPAGVSVETVFPVVLPRRGEASVIVDDDGGYAADDARHLLLAPPEPLSIAVVTASGELDDEAFYLQQALAADTDRFAITAPIAAEIAATLERDGARPDVVVLTTSRGLDRRGLAAVEAFAEAGGGVLLVAGPATEPAMLSGFGGVGAATALDSSAAVRRLVPADHRHPVFRAFGRRLGNLAQVRYARTRALDVAEPGRVLARFSDGGAALAEHRLGQGRLLVFGSDMDDAWNDFPRHPTFVPFVHEAMRFLDGDRPPRREWLIGDAPGPAGGRPGFVTLDVAGRRVAVNVDRRESDLARMSVDEFQAAADEIRGAARDAADDVEHEQERDQGYWRYGLGLMALALAAESLLGRRMG